MRQCVEKFCFHLFHPGSITTFAEGSGKHTMNIGGGVPRVSSCLPVPVTCEGMPPGSAATSTPLTCGGQQTTSVQPSSTGSDGGVPLTIPIQPGSFRSDGVPIVVPQPRMLTPFGPSISAMPGYCQPNRMTNPAWTATMPGYSSM